MCRLCERDKGKMYPGNVTTHIADDRLAVLERDHEAMQRLRNNHTIKIEFFSQSDVPCAVWRAEGIPLNDPRRYTNFAKDPAEAILNVKEEDGEEK